MSFKINKNELNAKEIKEFIKYHIENNKILVSEGQLPLAISISGEAGMGKSSLPKEIAEEIGMRYCKLVPQQCGEVSDFQGYMIRQFLMCHPAETTKNVLVKKADGTTEQRKVTEKFEGESCVWVDEQFIPEWEKKGYQSSGKNRASYCPPEWAAAFDEPVMLVIDDWTRKNIFAI